MGGDLEEKKEKASGKCLKLEKGDQEIKVYMYVIQKYEVSM